jgi:hypothetical protein
MLWPFGGFGVGDDPSIYVLYFLLDFDILGAWFQFA